MEGLIAKLIGELPALLPKVKYNIAPVLRYAKQQGIAEAGLKQLRDAAMPLAAEGLAKAGLGRQAAAGRLMVQSAEELGQLPKAHMPQPGRFELTKPELPAMTPELDLFKKGARQLKPLKGAAKYMNPAYQGEHVFGSQANPALDAIDAVTHWQGNVSYWNKSFGPVLKKLGVGDPRKDREFVTDMMTGYRATLEDSQQIEKLMDTRNSLVAEINKMNPSARRRPTEAALDEVEHKIQFLRDKINLVNQPVMQKWAGRSGSVRVMLGLEPETYPWVERMLNPKEKEARDAIRKSLDLIKGRAGELDIPVVTKGSYAPHYTGRIIRELEKSAPDIAAKAKSFSLPEELRWAHRSAGSAQWWPVLQHMPRYYADAHRRLAFTPFLKKWNPVIEGLRGRGMNYEADTFKKWAEDMVYGEPMQKGLISKLVAAEYMDKVGLSPSTAFKHAAKALIGYAFHPVYFGKGAVLAFGEAGRWGLRKLGVDLAKHGIDSGDYARFARYYLQSRALFRGFSGIDPGRGLSSVILSNTLAQPTAAMEAFERFAMMTGMMMKGMSKDVNMARALQQMYHGLLDVSFVGHVDRYPWLKKPLQQLFFLFYYTPLRVSERTLKTLAYSVIPEREMLGFKNNVIQTAAHMRRDPMGGTYMGKLVRAGLVVGGAEALARANDTSIWEFATMHLPFFRHGRTGEYEAVIPPPVEVVQRINQLGWNRDAVLAALVNHYGLYTAKKLASMTDPETLIPQIYKRPGSPELEAKIRYWAGLPSLSAIADMNAKHAVRLQRQRSQRMAMMEKQDKWKYNIFEGFKNFLQRMAMELTVSDKDPEDKQ